MTRRKRWLSSEITKLIDNYKTMSIKELMELFPTRSQDGINDKIKQLKQDKKISENRTKETVERAYRQRQR